MRLARVFIENFRGIGRLELSLDPVTVVIGENNTGKTSVFDALGLCLGRPGAPFPTHFRQGDFRRSGPRGSAHPIRITLSFTCPADPPLPAHSPLRSALTHDEQEVGRVDVQFRGHPSDGRILHRFVDASGTPLDPQPPASALDELRRLHPVLLLRFAQRAAPDLPGVEGTRSPPVRGELRRRWELESEVARAYQELSTARGPVRRDHLRRGLDAAVELFEGMRRRGVEGPAPLEGILDTLVPTSEREADRSGDSGDLELAGSGSHTLGLLMVLGAMLDVRGDAILPEEAEPVIAIEEPEVHLHPILLASTWDVIESLGARTLVTTNSAELLSYVPLQSLRRLSRRDGQVQAHQLHPGQLSETELRRVAYHIRAKRGGALFSRCWLLVEGESEFWLLRQLAHVLGHDLDAEGVRCVEFAQCGVGPLVKLAEGLGIEWHLLADGDQSGGAYVAEAERYLGGEKHRTRISRLRRRDIERCFWYHGYQQVYLEAAGLQPEADRRRRAAPPGRVIARAIRARSKPYLARMVAEAAATRGREGVPPVLRHVIETSVALARDSVRERRG